VNSEEAKGVPGSSFASLIRKQAGNKLKFKQEVGHRINEKTK
jgi:hypothetical protein